jgi:hypothetical protein
MNGMKGRMELLNKMWVKEHHHIVMTLSKNKHKTKKQKDFLVKVRGIPDSIKEALLQKYIEKCKHQNAVQFFEWRKKYRQDPNEMQKLNRGQ